MTRTIEIADRVVGPGHRTYVIAEIGINHNGSLATALELIDAAKSAGCDAVKFQKRTVDAVYSQAELARPRESPFGTTNGDLKHALELSENDYRAIDAHCRAVGITWMASCWDEESVEFIGRFSPPCYKIASPSLTDDSLLRKVRATGRVVILSTGMSSPQQIEHAVELLGKDQLALLHCTSTYPSKVDELNLRVIPWLAEKFGVPVGYSGHEVGLATSIAAVALGACVIERHITLDRTLWGSDQAASVEPGGFARLVKDIRAVEAALGDGTKRIYDSEIPVREKLRRVK
jgi:N-acetylneuraminate synthase